MNTNIYGNIIKSIPMINKKLYITPRLNWTYPKNNKFVKHKKNLNNITKQINAIEEKYI